MFADDDVSRLDVAVEHAAAVCVVDRVADVHEAAEELAELQRTPAGIAFPRPVGVVAVDRLLEAVAADESHGIERPPVGVGAEAVDGDDSGVLQAAGDLSLEQEAAAADRVVGVVVEDLLQRHLAVQFVVERHEDGAQATPGVRPEDAEPLAVGRGGAHGVVGREVGVGGAVAVGRPVPGPDTDERRSEVRVAHAGQPHAG